MSDEYTQVDQIISTQIAQQFPDFLRDDAPLLVKFVKAYYQWMERVDQTNAHIGNVIDRTNALIGTFDVDTTEPEFLQWFEHEFLFDVPHSLQTDKRQLIKHALDIYRAKGSTFAYKIFFRAVFNDEIKIFDPGTEILRASDGRWEQQTSLRVGNPSSGNLAELAGEFIQGVISGTTARVDSVQASVGSGVSAQELFITNLSDDFIDGEQIVGVSSPTITATLLSSIGPTYSVDIELGGRGHQEGDRVSIIQVGGGSGAVGTVTETDDLNSISFAIANGGSGYSLNSNTTISFLGGSGSGASFTIDSLVDTESISVNQDLLEIVRLCELVEAPTFVSAGANTADTTASFAAADINTDLVTALDFSPVTVGSIGSISTTSFGSGYTTLPTVSVRHQRIAQLQLDSPHFPGQDKGADAQIIPVREPGSIREVAISFGSRGSGYSPLSLATIQNITRTGTDDASGFPLVTAVIEYPGRYIDTNGFLSWNMKLQDNFYYQEFSYDIHSQQPLREYRGAILNTIHPAGTELFGTFVIDTVETLQETSPYGANNKTRSVWQQASGTLKVSTVNESWIANGTGTKFGSQPEHAADVANGDTIFIDGGYYTVNTHTSNVALTLSPIGDNTSPTWFSGTSPHANIVFYVMANTDVIT